MLLQRVAQLVDRVFLNVSSSTANKNILYCKPLGDFRGKSCRLKVTIAQSATLRFISHLYVVASNCTTYPIPNAAGVVLLHRGCKMFECCLFNSKPKYPMTQTALDLERKMCPMLLIVPIAALATRRCDINSRSPRCWSRGGVRTRPEGDVRHARSMPILLPYVARSSVNTHCRR